MWVWSGVEGGCVEEGLMGVGGVSFYDWHIVVWVQAVHCMAITAFAGRPFRLCRHLALHSLSHIMASVLICDQPVLRRFFADMWMLFPTEDEYIKVGSAMNVES
jgi:hypothetical protein